VSAPPGMIGLVPMGGAGGRLIRIGQFLNGDGFEDFQHAFVALPGNMIIEAEPGGARIVPLRYAGVYWCEGIHGLLNAAAADVAMTAQGLKGTPYSWLDYGALFTHRLRIPVPGLREFIADSGHQICSQLADELYLRLGAHIFDDGRWPGYVTPGALYRRDLELRST
jgi:hypothetical protein